MISLNDIHLSYAGIPLFTRFSLHVAAGETVIIKAPSGRGKTTLLRIILGFENGYSGECAVDGIVMAPGTVREIRRKIAYVSQDVELPQMSVRGFLDETFSFEANSSRAFSEQSFHHLAGVFRMPDGILSMNTADLSGGERQRLGIITALLLDRPVLLMDEPTSALDEGLKQTVMEQLSSIKKTLLVVSHDELWHRKSKIRPVTL
ncbi:MAG: ABC transporter ATP-binding protein [Spirochaetota bacterium]